jgi:hypothetical protein
MMVLMGGARSKLVWLPALALGCAGGFPGDVGGQLDGSVDSLDGGAGDDSGGDDVSPACAAALAEVTFDFEAGPAGWTHDLMPEIAGTGVDWRFDDWEHGTATEVGPAACHAGTGCWATRLDNNYIACQRAYLMSPPLDLSPCAGEELAMTFFHAYDFWTGDWEEQTWFDGGLVELGTDGETWTAPPGLELPGTIAILPDKGVFECIEPDAFYVHGQKGYVGSNPGWEPVEFAIPPELVTTDLRVRFSYSSGVSIESSSQNPNAFANAGWYIDDVAVTPR